MSKKNILLCISGGIAAYKTPALVRILRKQDFDVEIILTEAAENFVSPLVLATLSGRRVWLESDFFSEERGHEIPHIKLSRWADVILLAPCTANIVAKIAHGISDGLLTSALLAADLDTTKILIFPAMNENMYDNLFTQKNLDLIRKRANDNLKIIEPEIGALACGVDGKGRMPDPENILLEIKRALEIQDMAGKNVLVTAGPTHEYLDPVRFISNPSTGKMGLAMARAAWFKGANVKMICGPVSSDFNYYGFDDVIKIISAQEMLEAVLKNLEWADIIIKAAAVGDYRAENIAPQKLKRAGKNELELKLVQNPDIAFEVGKLKRPDQILIGFAAETENLIANAQEKLTRKNLDYILVNDVTAENSGFASDTNTIKIISRNENFKDDENTFTGLKEDVATGVLAFILSR